MLHVIKQTSACLPHSIIMDLFHNTNSVGMPGLAALNALHKG